MQVLMISGGVSPTVPFWHIRLLKQMLAQLKTMKFTLLCQRAPEGAVPENLYTIAIGDIIMDFQGDESEIDKFARYWQSSAWQLDVILAGSDAVIEFAAALGQKLKVPVVAFFYGVPEARLLYPYFQYHYSKKMTQYNQIQHVIFCSNVSFDRAVALGFKNPSNSLTPLGIEDTSDILVARLERPPNVLHCIMVNRDASHKNLEDFFYLAQQHPQDRFYWITTGMNRPVVKYMVKSLPNLTVHENISEERKFALMKACDIFFCPSTDEGYMLTCMEALRVGLPVIVKESAPALEVLWEFSHQVSYYNSHREAASQLRLFREGPRIAEITGVTMTQTIEHVANRLEHIVAKGTKNEV